MISYNKFILPNGLTVIHHEDTSSQLCAINTLFKVGSKDEDQERTGFAHLFEHLMFSGSRHVTEFDSELQKAGGESNAFTSNDLTNYYLTLPSNNIETGFWIESDRMLALEVNQQNLDVQRNVVIEEFKERYLSQPYGDIWLKLLPLAYQVHPYRWPTIGKDISHIENARLSEVKNFFVNFYSPSNAILSISGNISFDKAKYFVNKWYENIPKNNIIRQPYLSEPIQTEKRTLHIQENVPLDVIIKAYHTCSRMNDEYYPTDLLADILGNGRSSRLFNQLVKKRQIFSDIETYLTGDIEPGLLVIEGRLVKGITFEQAEDAISIEIHSILKNISGDELQKVKNKTETNILFNDMGVLNKAMKLAYCEFLGDIEIVNKEIDYYQVIEMSDILHAGNNTLQECNCSTIYYHSK